MSWRLQISLAVFLWYLASHLICQSSDDRTCFHPLLTVEGWSSQQLQTKFHLCIAIVICVMRQSDSLLYCGNALLRSMMERKPFYWQVFTYRLSYSSHHIHVNKRHSIFNGIAANEIFEEEFKPRRDIRVANRFIGSALGIRVQQSTGIDVFATRS